MNKYLCKKDLKFYVSFLKLLETLQKGFMNTDVILRGEM